MLKAFNLVGNTNYTVGDSETFNLLFSLPTGTLIRGVSFAPIPEPSALAIFGAGLLGLFGLGLMLKLSGT
jgi:hypothetical protein